MQWGVTSPGSNFTDNPVNRDLASSRAYPILSIAMRKLESGQCKSCGKQFGYYLIHSGFNDSVYAYCDSCGMTADLSIYDKRMPKLHGCAPFQEICPELEPHIQPCQCGGSFKKGASPRCPHCGQALSAEDATNYGSAQELVETQ